MYFPFLRGKQYELIALRELVENNCISDNIYPIIEPLKKSATFVKTLEYFKNEKQNISVIINPEISTFENECIDMHNYVKSILVTENISDDVLIKLEKGSFISIYKGNNSISGYEKLVDLDSIYNIIPDESNYRRNVRDKRVVLRDGFIKQKRNKDYLLIQKDEDGVPDEFFSEDHKFFKVDGYVGFSDYSIVGADYINGGFAPTAVAIHIVYFDKTKTLRIKHFVSNSNEDINDPAGKFGEALKKLVIWYEKNKTNMKTTYGLSELVKYYYLGTYPGLAVVKKLSIMHHIELVNSYLMEN